MSDMLHDAFAALGQKKSNASPLPSHHPDEATIISQLKDILYELPTGRILIDFLNSHNIPASVIPGRDADFSCPEGKSIVLICPVHKNDNIINELTLGLAAGIRTAYNFSQGYVPTTASPDTIEWKNEHAAKLLDIILLICHLAEELEAVKKDTKFVALLKRLGQADIYEAFLNKAPYEELEKIMLKSINK